MQDDGDVQGKKGKSHKRRPADAPPGPGKNWRKGLKKYVSALRGSRDSRAIFAATIGIYLLLAQPIDGCTDVAQVLTL